MIEIKTFEGRLNLDDNQYRLPKGDYIQAENITKDAVEGSNDKVITNLVANRIGDENYTLPSGRNVCIGAYANTLRGTVIQFIWNENNYHLILEYDTTLRIQTVILANLTDSDNVDILGFTEFGKITGVNIYNRDEGDLLCFLDSLGRPTYLDITAFKNGTYTPVTRDIIDLATRPPLAPPQGVYDNDTSQNVNYLINKFFRFKYRWITDDNRKSTTSPISEVLIPTGFLSDAVTSVQTNNNVINLSINSGDKDVKSVQILMSFVEKSNTWNDFLIVDTIDKEKLSINDNSIFSYQFYNDSTYPALDINESIQLFDYVPLYANAQELANGNVLIFGGITEGYDNALNANVVNVVSTYPISSPTSGSLTSITTYEGDNILTYQARTIFAGIPAVGTTVEITVKKQSDSLYERGAFYTTIAGDTIANVVNGLAASFSSYPGVLDFRSSNPSGGRITYEWLKALYFKDIVVNIVAPTSSLSSNSIPVWKWSSQRNIGIAYFDNKGRTNGIVYNAKITFPAYLEDVSGNVYLPTINTKIYHTPPIWAYSFQFLFTKDNTYFLFWATNSINTAEADYIYLEVTDFDANAIKFPTTITNLSYSFQDGDRMRLIKPIGTYLFYGDDYDAAILGLLVEPKINGVVQTGKKFLKIKKVTPFSNGTFTGYDNFVIEIYRPTQQTANEKNQVYYECGRQYDILNPTTPLRVHSGEVTNQSVDYVTPAEFNFTKGGSYYRQRIIALNDTTTILFNVQDLNIIDNYISAVNSIDGRPNTIDVNARQAYYSTLVRFGQAYQPNTNINGLNRFYPANFDEYDYTYGAIQRFISRDRYIRVFQQYKIGSVPLFNQISKNADGTQLLVVTDKLLNPIQYYAGNFGLGLKESLASFNFADYGCDNVRGIIWRVSNDGVTPISVVYKINSWASQELPLRTGDKKGYGVFDQRLNNYILALDAVPCEGVEAPDFNLDGANTGSAFTQTVILTGSLNFTLSNITKPSWMTIQIDGYNLNFSGTPSFSDAGTDIPVNFNVSNDCGLIEVFKTIDVTAVSCVAVSPADTPVLPDGTVNVSYSYSFDLSGTAPFTLTNVVKPTWMSIIITGSTVYISGTPDTTGTNIPVTFTVNNCASDTYDFSDTIDITALTNCIFLMHQSETIGGSIFMKGTAAYAVASIVTVNFTITTTDDTYTNNVIFQIGNTVTPLVKIEYNSGNPGEAFVSQVINSITPSSDSSYTYSDCI